VEREEIVVGSFAVVEFDVDIDIAVGICFATCVGAEHANFGRAEFLQLVQMFSNDSHRIHSFNIVFTIGAFDNAEEKGKFCRKRRVFEKSLNGPSWPVAGGSGVTFSGTVGFPKAAEYRPHSKTWRSSDALRLRFGMRFSLRSGVKGEIWWE
jgi:hypothetical protein